MTETHEYTITLPDGSEEKRELTITSRVESFEDFPELRNPSGDPKAYFYCIQLDSQSNQVTAFKPGKEGYQAMTKKEAEDFLAKEIKQILANYHINV